MSKSISIHFLLSLLCLAAAPTVCMAFWHTDTYNGNLLGPSGNTVMWCGTDFGPPFDEGYGNNWIEDLDFTHTVDDNALSSSVTIEADMHVDVDSGADFLALQYESAAFGWTDIATWNLQGSVVAVSEAVTYLPPDYTGSGQDEIHLRWRVTTDANTSDQDLGYDSQGAVQLDNILVTTSNKATYFEDFEPGHEPIWTPVSSPSATGPATPGSRRMWANASPNPCNPRTSIEYRLPVSARTTLVIYDLQGRRAATLVDEVLPAGPGRAAWSGRDDAGRRVPSGVYFYRLFAAGEVRMGKLTLLK